MYNITYTKKFERNLKKLFKNGALLYSKIKEIIYLLVEDPFNPKLKTHKLTGSLAGLYALSCGYDCRIIFEIVSSKIVI